MALLLVLFLSVLYRVRFSFFFTYASTESLLFRKILDTRSTAM
jgi:hypothetical protein